MDISKFSEHLNVLQYTNFSLTPDEAIRVQNSLIVLQSKNKFEKIFFWGKLLCPEVDYFIAFGYKIDCLRHRKFFYSQDAIEWMMLPNPQVENEKACIISDKFFTGDPGVEEEVLLDPEFEKKNGVVTQLDARVGVKLKEEQRLACLVKMVTEEAGLVPRKGLYARTDNIVTFNKAFQGLKFSEAGLLSNYQLYREPLNKYNFNLLKRTHFNYTTDFLDTLDDIIPLSRSFIIKFERNNEIVIVKSLHWPGMIFYHQLNTALHGFVYFGMGKKNLDLLFTL